MYTSTPGRPSSARASPASTSNRRHPLHQPRHRFEATAVICAARRPLSLIARSASAEPARLAVAVRRMRKSPVDDLCGEVVHRTLDGERSAYLVRGRRPPANGGLRSTISSEPSTSTDCATAARLCLWSGPPLLARPGGADFLAVGTNPVHTVSVSCLGSPILVSHTAVGCGHMRRSRTGRLA